MSFSTLKNRLAVAGAMLIKARDDKAVMASKAEAAAFLEVLAQTRNLSAVDCAALVEFSSTIQWQQCDANAVLRALCSSDSTPSSGRDHKTGTNTCDDDREQGMQNFRTSTRHDAIIRCRSFSDGGGSSGCSGDLADRLKELDETSYTR